MRSQLDATFRFSGKDWPHSLPFVVDSGYHILIYLQGPAFVERWKKDVHSPYHFADVAFVVYTVLSIYYCGFNSKATFNRAYKKRMGISPRHYTALYCPESLTTFSAKDQTRTQNENDEEPDVQAVVMGK